MNRDEIRADLGADWSMSTLDVWRRAQYRCEYCRKRLLDNVDEYYFDSHIDHIVPGMGDDESNLALTCKACNFIKRNYDFRRPEMSNSRLDLISRAAAYIASKRSTNMERLAKDIQLLKMLDELDKF